MDEFEALFGDIGAFNMEQAKADFMDLGVLAVGAVVGGVVYGMVDAKVAPMLPLVKDPLSKPGQALHAALPLVAALAVSGLLSPRLYGNAKKLSQGAALGMFIVGVRAFYKMAQTQFPTLPALSGLGEDELLLADPFQKYLSDAPMTVEESVAGYSEQAPAPMTIEEESVAGFAGTLTI